MLEDMVANFFTNSTIPGDKFREAIKYKITRGYMLLLNQKKLMKIFMQDILAKGKTYSYTIINRYERSIIRKSIFISL